MMKTASLHDILSGVRCCLLSPLLVMLTVLTAATAGTVVAPAVIPSLGTCGTASSGLCDWGGHCPSSFVSSWDMVCSDKGMRIVLNIEEEDIERIARSLDNQYAYTLARNLEDSGYKRLAELFRGFLKRGPAQATSLCDQMEVPSKDEPVRKRRGR